MRRESILVLLTLLVLTTTGTALADLSDGLIAHYPLSGNADDASGYDNNGTIYGATPTTDRFGNPNSAYSFDGVDDYIAIPNDATQQITTNQITVSAWIKLNADVGNTQARTICKQALVPHNDLAWGLEIFGAGYGGSTGNQINFHDSNGSTWYNCLSSTHLNPFQLYHVAVTDNAGLITVYIDGREDYSSSSGFGIPSSIDAPIHIGVTNPPNRYFFNGTIDDIRIYDRALSGSEIHQLYVIPAPGALVLGSIGLTFSGWLLGGRRPL